VAGTISSRPCFAQLSFRNSYGFEDPGVAGASAKITGKPIAQSVVTGVRMAFQQIAGSHDHPWRADTALRPATRDECLLQTPAG